jgi:hypothetical protein
MDIVTTRGASSGPAFEIENGALGCNLYEEERQLVPAGQQALGHDLDDPAKEDNATVDHDLNDDPNANWVDDFCSTIFSSVSKLVLPHPTSPPTRAVNNCTRRVRKTRVATHSSLCLAARPSSVPVAERTQRKLMHELDFINNQSPAPDATITAYVDMYAGELPDQVVKVLTAAMRPEQQEVGQSASGYSAGDGVS